MQHRYFCLNCSKFHYSFDQFRLSGLNNDSIKFISMRMTLYTILKYGIYGTALLLSTDAIIWYWYLRKRNRIADLNEAVFIMSNAVRCCSHNADINEIQRCKNSNCKAKLSRKIIDHIDSAKHLICIAMYMFTMRHIGDAIINANRRGVKIRIISDSSMINTSGTQINRLQGSGIAVRIAGNGDLYMHNKFCLIDVMTDEVDCNENTHPLKGVLINGSLNWTSNGFDRNWENIIFTSDETMKSQFKRAFDCMWTKLE